MISSLDCVIWPLACMQTAAYLKHLYSSKSSVLLHSLLVSLLLSILFLLIVTDMSGMTVLVIVVCCRLSVYCVM